MTVKARLRGLFGGGDGARLDLEVTLVVRREDALHVDHGPLLVTLLDDRRERASDGVTGMIVIVIADLSAPSFRAADVQTMRAVKNAACWFSF